MKDESLSVSVVNPSNSLLPELDSLANCFMFSFCFRCCGRCGCFCRLCCCHRRVPVVVAAAVLLIVAFAAAAAVVVVVVAVIVGAAVGAAVCPLSWLNLQGFLVHPPGDLKK